MRGWRGVFAAGLLLTLAACGQKTAAKEPAVAKQLEVPRSTAVADVAAFLGGMPGRPDGPFRDLEKDAAWKWHVTDFRRMWQRFEQERLPVLQRFQQSEISGDPFANQVLFYPFGGPDVLTAWTFFPKKKTYILVGLEPPGTLPDEKAIQGIDLEKHLPLIRRTLDSLLRRSFFITANMDAQLRGQITDGVLPVMLVQLSRMHCEVLGSQPVTLDAEGKLIARVEEHKRASSLRNDGVALDFHCGSDASDVRRLLYFSVNLNDEALAGNAAFQSFLKAQQPVTTFIKSASYLPHRKDFSRIRELVLENSRGIVQDDTGIPYRFVDKTKWDVRLYGKYSQPYGSFRYLVQPDLRKAFEDGPANPLEFYIGYGFGRAPSTLVVYSKKT